MPHGCLALTKRPRPLLGGYLGSVATSILWLLTCLLIGVAASLITKATCVATSLLWLLTAKAASAAGVVIGVAASLITKATYVATSLLWLLTAKAAWAAGVVIGVHGSYSPV